MSDGHLRRQRVGYFDIVVATPQEATARILQWASSSAGVRLVVTPNFSMFPLWERHPEFRRACERADLVLADGWPLAVVASCATGRIVPRVTGSDLLKDVIAGAAATGLRVGVIGGRNPERAVRRCRSAHPDLEMTVIDQAFHPTVTEALAETLADDIRAARADIIVLAHGTPRQEFLATLLARRLTAGVMLCLGGSIDFLSGDQKRAPAIISRLGLEAFWRMALDPQRILPRYVIPTAAFVRSLISQLRGH
ncbi:WecB/TagA/CpsF family glycosyltransferase [Geodermatophilus sp. SYSU D00696]